MCAWYTHQRVVYLQSFEEHTNVVDVKSFRKDARHSQSCLDEQDEVTIVDCQNIGRQILSKNGDGESWSVGGGSQNGDMIGVLPYTQLRDFYRRQPCKQYRLDNAN